MRKDLDEMLEILRDYFETVVPPLLSARGLKPVEKFLSEPADDVDEIQLSVYSSDGADPESGFSDGFLVEMQLPGVSNPVKYQSALYKKAIRAVDPKLIGAITKDTTYSVWYPGEIGGGGSSAFVVFEMRFAGESDDCEQEY